jgi:hypothetical protein
MAAVFVTINCFADGTNGVSRGNQERIIVPESGPLKELATVVLNKGKKMNLDTKGTLKPERMWWTSTFPENAALQLGLVSSNNEPFEVYGLDDFLPDPVYHDPVTISMIRVSQQRGKTDIIFAYVTGDIGHQTWYNLWLTSPSGEVEEAYLYWTTSSYSYNGGRYDKMVTMVTLEGFRRQTNFWSEKLGIIRAKSDEPKK